MPTTILEKKRGRPCKFGVVSNLCEKKRALFGENSNSEYFSLVNVAYHTNKISQREYDIAIYLEDLYSKIKKNLEVKTIPNSTAHTWSTRTTKSITYISSQSLDTWQKINVHLKCNAQEIAEEFIKLICSHHSYEELLALKTNQKVMNILKTGLKTVNEIL